MGHKQRLPRLHGSVLLLRQLFPFPSLLGQRAEVGWFPGFPLRGWFHLVTSHVTCRSSGRKRIGPEPERAWTWNWGWGQKSSADGLGTHLPIWAAISFPVHRFFRPGSVFLTPRRVSYLDDELTRIPCRQAAQVAKSPRHGVGISDFFYYIGSDYFAVNEWTIENLKVWNSSLCIQYDGSSLVLFHS